MSEFWLYYFVRSPRKKKKEKTSLFFFSFLFFPHKFQGRWFTLASDSDAQAHKRIYGCRYHGNTKANTAETGECGRGRNKCYFTRRLFNCQKVQSALLWSLATPPSLRSTCTFDLEVLFGTLSAVSTLNQIVAQS